MNPITTPRLILEPLRESHACKMWSVLTDRRIYDFLDAQPPASLAELTARFHQLEASRSPDGQELWLNWIVQTTGGCCIGYVQATIYPDRSAAVAFVIGSEYWGRGYGREATEAMLQSLTNHYSIRSAFATADSRNIPSQRLLVELGFRETKPSVFPHAIAQPGDVVLCREFC
jgi:ribosomal-protein-alanine N-acetyltransferase